MPRARHTADDRRQGVLDPVLAHPWDQDEAAGLTPPAAMVTGFMLAPLSSNVRLRLLTEKFNLFNGVFGASDEVLGQIESGVDFEKRILAIYQECRTPEAIDAAFRARGIVVHMRTIAQGDQYVAVEQPDQASSSR
mgnify:CR=1 FL=1